MTMQFRKTGWWKTRWFQGHADGYHDRPVKYVKPKATWYSKDYDRYVNKRYISGYRAGQKKRRQEELLALYGHYRQRTAPYLYVILSAVFVLALLQLL